MNRVIRVIGNPVQDAGLLIEITMQTKPLRAAMVDYGLRILFLSALISIVTAFLLFLAVQRLLVLPIRRVVRHMTAYAEAPEDARRVIVPSASVEELRVAEEALASMQTQLTGALRQKERLAQLGGAVAKISHDLRNILTTAQLFADRLEASLAQMKGIEVVTLSGLTGQGLERLLPAIRVWACWRPGSPAWRRRPSSAVSFLPPSASPRSSASWAANSNSANMVCLKKVPRISS